MKAFWKVAVVCLLISGFFFGLAFWAETGRAPYVVASSVDAASRLVSAVDPISRCFRTRTSNGFEYSDFIGPRECYNFGPKKEFSGIYFDEFEGQIFIEGAKAADKYLARRDVWLSFDEKSKKNGHPVHIRHHGITRVWQIRFYGREASGAGSYGHLGMSETTVLVDNLVDAKLVHRGRGYLSEQLVDHRYRVR